MTRLLRTMRKAGLVLLLALCAWPTEAQWRERRSRPVDRSGVPDWEVDKEVPRDVFTFVRLQYTHSMMRGRRGGRGGWQTDWPDADLNFSFRLHEMTSMRVEPDVDERDDKSIRIEDERLFNYPFVYIVEPGSLSLSDEEAAILRKYLLGGGFLMLDDFWGEAQWNNAADQIAKVFPERQPQDLPLDHPIFHCVFDLKEKPQLPSIYVAQQGYTSEAPGEGPNYRAIFDDKGRMMVIFCHNTDNGDGWEREAEDPWYFKNFSEPKAYPMGINIIFYAMTH
jgi:hypothetical protein